VSTRGVSRVRGVAEQWLTGWRARWTGDRRVRILLWATIAALVTGLLGLGTPVDDYARGVRNRVRSTPPSGQIVIVAIDDSSLAKIGEWPWPRHVHAQLVDSMSAAGAREVFFDILFSNPSNEADDRRFADAIRRAGNVWLESTDVQDALSRKWIPQPPLPMFARHAKLASTRATYSNLGFVRSLEYRPQTLVGDYPYMGAAIAGVDGPKGAKFRIDYAIDLTKIPTHSAADVLAGNVPMSAFRDKQVVVAFARTNRDNFMVPLVGLVNGGHVMIVSAETLRAGGTVDLGWLAPLMITLMLAIAHVRIRKAWARRSLLTLAVFGFAILPLITESYGYFYDVLPAVVLHLGVVAAWAWANFRNSYKVRGDINAVSGLPNLNALRREKVVTGAVLVGARINNFAEIGATLKPHEECALVEQITHRLALGARGARIYQGDEGIFVWVANDETSDSDHLDALHALFRSPALLDRRSIDLSVTFGVDAHGGRELANRIGATLAAADQALQEGLRWKAYDPGKLADAEWKLSLLGRLDAAIDSGEIWVAYQPQLDLKTGRICGAEALVRWSHPEKGEISPADFVVAAEQHDRIDRLTQFVLRDALRVAAEINARGTPFDMAVNLSARLLEKPGLTTMVREMLDDAQLGPERLTLEVTESAAMTSGRTSIRTLEELGSLGISVSIDDYGTGFSTLEYFKLIPAAEVKIDRGFIAAMDRSASDRLMVRSTIELAHSLGRTVVAEGIESREILAELRAIGCDRAQGYLIGRPMRAAQLANLIANRKEPWAA
jgi:EAL domain-containing protein (putative c-di-GMP-specific phosphodiesterase class I)